MRLKILNAREDSHLLSIEELKDLRLRKKRIESEKKARKYIQEINRKYKIWTDPKTNKFFTKAS